MNKTKIENLLKPYNKNKRRPITVADFERHAKRYIKACKQNRMICSVDKVSASGMSRTLKFLEMNGKGNSHYLYNFYLLFDILGYQKVKDSDYFRISGCGMDMVFNTNYTIIHELKSLGFITQKTCGVLAQMQPHNI